MAGFGFDEGQELFRQQIRDFARKELAPGAKERAKIGETNVEMAKKLASIGLMSMRVPEKYGGVPTSWVNLGIAVEELAKVDFSMGYYVIGVPGFLGQVFTQANEEIQDEWFPKLINVDAFACFCLTEPDCGSDAAAIKTRAVKDGDYYIINGEKTSVSNGLQASIAAVFVKTNPEAGAKGVSCILVPLDLPGITRGPLEDSGWIPMRRAWINFDDVRVPTKYLVGEEGKGFYTALGTIGGIRVCLGMLAVGKAEGAMEEAIAYAKQRTAFGRPLARFQGTAFKIAEHATVLEAARLLCYRALWMKDQGMPNNKEVAMAKWFSTRMAVMAVHDMLLVHGHVGYTEEYPIEQHLRDVIGNEIGDGMAEIMKLIICRDLFGKEFEPL